MFEPFRVMPGPSVESLCSIDANGAVAWAAAAGDIQASVAVADDAAIVVSVTDERGPFRLRRSSWIAATTAGRLSWVTAISPPSS